MNYAGFAIQAVGAGMEMANARRNAELQKIQGRVASQQSVADADALMRDYRQLAGRQAATIAQGGGTYEGSAGKVLRQSEVLANLDRLTKLYSGELRRIGFNTEAESTIRRGFLAGTKALAGGASDAGLFGGGQSMPSYGR